MRKKGQEGFDVIMEIISIVGLFAVIPAVDGVFA